MGARFGDVQDMPRTLANFHTNGSRCGRHIDHLKIDKITNSICSLLTEHEHSCRAANALVVLWQLSRVVVLRERRSAV